MKLFIKLLIAAVILNAVWQVASAYISHYNFQDSVREATLTRRQTDDQLRQRIMGLATDNEIPITEEEFTIRHGERHIYVNGSYERGVALFPGVVFPLNMTLSVDSYVLP